jgi:hypothetical protein
MQLRYALVAFRLSWDGCMKPSLCELSSASWRVAKALPNSCSGSHNLSFNTELYTIYSSILPLLSNIREQSNMHISFTIIVFLLGTAAAQTYSECTMEVARSDDCAAVINANACYNKFRWNAQTLTCIDGTDNAVKAKKVCARTILYYCGN